MTTKPSKGKREIKRSSAKTFKGSKPSDFYGEGYFLKGEGSNYGRKDEEGNLLYAPYVLEAYLQGRRLVARNILHLWPRIKSVMVLGCARGYFVAAFRELGVHAVGVDISEWAIENCMEGMAEYLYQGDVCDLSLWEDNEFDLVLAFDVLEHIELPDLKTAIDEAVRIGKMTILDVPIAPDDKHPDQSEGTDKSHVSVYSQDWWLQQFLNRGQEVIRSKEYVYPEEHEESPWPDKHDHAVTMYFQTPIPVPTVETIEHVEIAPEGDAFRIAWWSNSPWAPTGYGVGTAGVVYPLAYEYDMGVISAYGLEGRVLGFSDIEGRNPGARVTVFPRAFDDVGIDATKLVIANWRPHILITLFDIWIGDNPVGGNAPGWLAKLHPFWIPIIPVDHQPVPFPTSTMAEKAYKCVAMSQFGKRELEKAGIASEYIPHGTWTDTFTPPSTDEQKEADREFLIEHTAPLFPGEPIEPWSMDDFIIGINAANKDEKRKGYQKMFKGIQHFLEQNPDAKKDLKVHLHTWARFPGGLNLDHAAHVLGITPYIKKTHTWHMYSGMRTSSLAKFMRSHDIGMNCAWNEGFGIPLIEWASSGVPTIGTNFTSMPELIRGHGWLVEGATTFMDSMLANTMIPNEYAISECIEEAYNGKNMDVYSKAARKFSMDYDFEKVVVPLWKKLIEEVREELRPKTLEERWIHK